MGKIPEFRRQHFGGRADPSKIRDAGSNIRAIGQLNRQVVSTGTELAQKHIEIKEKEYLAQKGLAFELEVSDAYQQHQKKYQGDPLNKYGEFKENLDKIRGRYLEEAPTHRSRGNFSNSTNLMGMRLEHNNGNWENQRVAINTGERTQNALETIQTQALRVADPNQLEALIAKGDGAMVPLDDTHSPEKVAEAKEKFRYNAAMNSFEGMLLNNDLVNAKSLLESKNFDEHLGDDGIKRLKKMIASRERANKSASADLSRLKYSNPWKFVSKQGERSEFFQLGSGPEGVAQRADRINDLNNQYGTKLPFFNNDEVKLFKENFDNGNNSSRLDFLESIQKTPVNRDKLYAQMNIPKEVEFFTNFKNDSDKELFIEATVKKFDTTENTKPSLLNTSIAGSDFGKVLMDTATSISSNSAFRESAQNLIKTMENISIRADDPQAGPAFFKKNFNTLSEDRGIFSGSGSMRLFFPKEVDAEKLEDGLIETKAELIRNKTKGLDSVSAYNLKSHLEDSTMWLNGPNGPELIETVSGKSIDLGKKLSFDNFKENSQKKIAATPNNNKRLESYTGY